MRAWLSIAVLAGCGFRVPAIGSGDDAPGDARGEGSIDDGTGAPLDGPPLTVSGVPGGVATTQLLWLAADRGLVGGASGSPVTMWMDQSLGAHHASAPAGEEPILEEGSFNFSPALVFTDDRLVSTSVFGGATYTELALFIVLADETDSDFDWIMREGVMGGTRFSLSRNFNGNSNTDFDATTGNRMTTTFSPTATLFTATWSTTGTPRRGLYADGGTSLVSSSTDFTPYVGEGDHMQIGDHDIMTDAPNNPFDGRIAEIYLVADTLSANERNRIETALAIEHGISLGHDYVTSTGDVVWPRSGAYANDVAGIGHDEAGNVYQRQSRSSRGLALVTIGAGGIAKTNAANGTMIADGSFLIWGHDNNGLVWQTEEKPATVARRLTREWRAIETGTVGMARVRVPDDSVVGPTDKLPSETGGIVMLVDNDANFGTNGTVIPMTFAGGYWECDVDFSATSFFTFADL